MPPVQVRIRTQARSHYTMEATKIGWLRKDDHGRRRGGEYSDGKVDHMVTGDITSRSVSMEV